MTQTIAIRGTSPEINPLYIKMRRRFAGQNDRTIGEIKAQEAIRDGYEPYAIHSGVLKHTAAECHVTRANSLPVHENKNKWNAPRPIAVSGISIAVIVVGVILLFALLLSGLHINRLHQQLALAQNNTEILQNQPYTRTLIPENTEQHASSNEFPDTEAAADKQILLDNLLRAFSAA